MKIRVVEKFHSVDQQNILQSVVSIKQRIHFLTTPIYYYSYTIKT
ncbi:hypothetical protein LEP1GSC073_2804 [Leptospira noguchii str. Cascata]|nr:hypothetical protein LEP1GSC073_2804 [Leptospira noguchii str. Cascata]